MYGRVLTRVRRAVCVMQPPDGMIPVSSPRSQQMGAKSAKKEESESKNGQKVGRWCDKEQQGVGSSA